MSESGAAGQGGRMTQAARDEQSRQRRKEVLALPMVPLRPHGYLDWRGHGWRGPVAVSVGPDDIAVAAWPLPAGEHGVVVTSHDGNAPYSEEPHRSRIRPTVSALEVPTSLNVSHVQPLPDGKILVACARTQGTDNAEIWAGNGQREHAGMIGDAIEYLLTTPSGGIWAGYSDEGIFGTGPSSHGLVRFTADLTIDWAYPWRELPPIDDCYALNVSGETATICTYSKFHLITVTGDRARDHGQVPARGAHRLLTTGERAALIGGYGPEYDLITPLRITPTGVTPHGPQRRLVLPDGLEIPRGHATCRGPDLHFFPRDSPAWYQLGLDDITS